MWFGYVTLLFFTTDSVFGMVLGFASLGAVLGIYSKEKSIIDNILKINNDYIILNRRFKILYVLSTFLIITNLTLILKS
jgi:hypothetical protein